MTRFTAALALSLALGVSPAWAGWFDKGIGSAMIYGPYTGGHGYSYNTAYSYGFAFSAADTWRRDIFAYPAGIAPYRPYDRPISKRVFPHPETPYVSVPGPDGLPMLIRPGASNPNVPHTIAMPPEGLTSNLRPVPTSPAVPTPQPVAPVTNTIPTDTALLHVRVPDGAEIWIEQEKMTQTGTARVFQTPALTPGRTHVYTVRAKWLEAGREVEQIRVVGVKAGESARLSFAGSQP